MDTAQTIRKIKSEYDRAVSRDEKIAKIEASAKTALEKYEAASRIAERTGMTTSQVLLSNLLELYPDGNIPEDAAKALTRPTLEHNHKYVLGKAVDAQAVMNEEAEVGLAPLAADFDTRQADAVVEKLAGYDDISAHQSDIEKQIVAASRKTVDETMRVNAEAHTNAGMNVTVTRIYDGIGIHNRKDRCQWCLSRCGNDMPYREAYNKGAFERHPGCGCEIFYKTGKRIQRQVNWKDNSWEETTDRDIIKTRKDQGLGQQFHAEQRLSEIGKFLSAESRELLEIAKSGGANNGTYRQALEKTKPQLERSINSHIKAVRDHIEKLNNPTENMHRDDPNDPVARRREINDWLNHRRRNAEQAAIEIEIWRDNYGQDGF